jgi:asparagine synthase (glutamine-hydrolysing)
LLQFLDKEALLGLCTENRSIPWYGQLMTTPQTIAYLIQLNYWMEKWKVKIRV